MTVKQPLTQNDLDNLARSFITADIADRAGFFRVDDLEGSELIGAKRNAGANYSGVAMPYFVPGQTNPREYRLRRDDPYDICRAPALRFAPISSEPSKSSTRKILRGRQCPP